MFGTKIRSTNSPVFPICKDNIKSCHIISSNSKRTKKASISSSLNVSSKFDQRTLSMRKWELVFAKKSCTILHRNARSYFYLVSSSQFQIVKAIHTDANSIFSSRRKSGVLVASTSCYYFLFHMLGISQDLSYVFNILGNYQHEGLHLFRRKWRSCILFNDLFISNWKALVNFSIEAWAYFFWIYQATLLDVLNFAFFKVIRLG